MILRRRPAQTTIVLGLWALALRSILQTALDRSGRTTNLTDFALGLLMGIGIGLVGLGIWRRKRERRDASCS